MLGAVVGATLKTEAVVEETRHLEEVQILQIKTLQIIQIKSLTRRDRSMLIFQTMPAGPVLSTGVKVAKLHTAVIQQSASGTIFTSPEPEK